MEHRVLLLETDEGVKVDVALAAFPFEVEAIEHSTAWDLVGGEVVWTRVKSTFAQAPQEN